MKLWLLKPIKYAAQKTPWDEKSGPYDMQHGAVVRAETETEARSIAAETAGDETKAAWHAAYWSTCTELTAEGEAGTILTDYWAG